MMLLLLLLSCLGVQAASPARKAPVVLLEAEQFAKLGGWLVDQQFMDQMDLLAHGLGEPVRDAETTAQFPAAGVGVMRQNGFAHFVKGMTRNETAPV